MYRLKTMLGLLLGALVICSCQTTDQKSTGTDGAPPQTQKEAPKKLVWLESYDEGMKVAAAENKLVMLKFTADW